MKYGTPVAEPESKATPLTLSSLVTLVFNWLSVNRQQKVDIIY